VVLAQRVAETPSSREAAISSSLLYPFIIFAGALQALGAAMNGQLNKSLVNPWLASIVSFVPVVAVLVILFAVQMKTLPSGNNVAAMPWWAPLGGITGAVAVFAGLLFIQRIGAGPFNGLTIAANLIASIAIDQFGIANVPQHPINALRVVGAILMVAGVSLIARF